MKILYKKKCKQFNGTSYRKALKSQQPNAKNEITSTAKAG